MGKPKFPKEVLVAFSPRGEGECLEIAQRLEDFGDAYARERVVGVYRLERIAKVMTTVKLT